MPDSTAVTVDLGQLGGGEVQPAYGSDVVLPLLHAARPDQGGGDAGVPEHPGQGRQLILKIQKCASDQLALGGRRGTGIGEALSQGVPTLVAHTAAALMS